MIGAWFHAVDANLAWLLPDHARLLLWAFGSGALSMLLYGRSSPQQKMLELDTQAALVRRALASQHGEFVDALPLIRENLSIAWHRLRIAIIPSLLGGLPIILCLIGLGTIYTNLEFIGWGPDWMRHWVTGFVLTSSVAALITKRALRIK